MANDISKAVSSNDIKNGSVVTNTLFTGRYQTYDYYVKNTPTIGAIEAKYDNRFYNGIFVQLVGSGIVIGG